MAKKVPGKDAVALFGIDTNNHGNQLQCQHLHKWSSFTQGVCGEKLNFLEEAFNLTGKNTKGLPVGKTMLYKLKGLLEGLDTGENKINLARFLYTLARLQPPKQKDREKYQQQLDLYNQVTQQLYQWVKNETDRKELLTALHLAIYYLRDNQGI